jgi:alpha-tubulin suppressor-like RCC1 family protein
VGGNNASGQLGLGTTVQQVGMVQVPGITDASSVYCDKTNANSLFSCLLRTNGTISFAGNNKGGVFGFTPNASAVNNTTFVTPTFAAQGTIKDVLATLNTVIIITTTGDIWRTGTLAVGGLGHTVPGTEPFSLKNCWKQMPCPEPVLAMRAFTTLSTPTDGVLLLTGNRGLFGFGHRNAFVTNLYYTSPNYSFREMGDIRQYDNGIAVTNPIAQVI